jgi:hypothetical protein
MEKRGVIEPGTTPPETDENKQQIKASGEKPRAVEIVALDADFRKRAADAAKK